MQLGALVSFFCTGKFAIRGKFILFPCFQKKSEKLRGNFCDFLFLQSARTDTEILTPNGKNSLGLHSNKLPRFDDEVTIKRKTSTDSHHFFSCISIDIFADQKQNLRRCGNVCTAKLKSGLSYLFHCMSTASILCFQVDEETFFSLQQLS